MTQLSSGFLKVRSWIISKVKRHDFFTKRSTVTPPTLIKVSSYKYLGVFLDNKLGFAEVKA